MWRLTGHQAIWQSNDLQTAIDLESPEQGLSNVVLREHRLVAAALMQLQPATVSEPDELLLQDCYVRDDDLVAVYSHRPTQLRTEFYWRLRSGELDGGRTWAVEAIFSVQTDLLDHNPRVDLCCRLPAISCQVLRQPDEIAALVERSERQTLEIERASEAWVVLRFELDHQPLAFAQLYSVADVAASRLQTDAEAGTIESTVSFFPGRLEKGVIRRARMRGILAARRDMDAAIRHHWRELTTAPPPLTT